MSRLYDSEYWRNRAEEARAQASEMKDERARKTLLDIAENYDQLAEQAEHLLRRSMRSPLS
jgi:hypothetical protein